MVTAATVGYKMVTLSSLNHLSEGTTINCPSLVVFCGIYVCVFIQIPMRSFLMAL